MKKLIAFSIVAFSFITPASAWDDAAKVVSTTKLGVRSDRYVGQRIQTNMNCAFIESGDVRCMVGNGDAIMRFSSIVGEGVEDHMSINCDELEVAMSKRACSFRVQFVYSANDTMELGNHSATVVIAEDNTGEFRLRK